jgi:plastocyanin
MIAWGWAIKLPQQARSRVQLGNEEGIRLRSSGSPDNSLSGWPKATRSRLLVLALSVSFPLSAGVACADVTGTVTLVGKPNSQDETFVAKANGCGESPIRKTENWKVGPKGELGDVVVWVVDPKYPPPVVSNPPQAPPPEVELKQLGCRYVPHVIAVQAGVNFKIINGDPTLHNVRAKYYNGPGKPPGDDVPGFNFGQTYQGQTDEKELDDPGIYTFQCDVHGWMQCWVMVLKSGVSGVTGPDGKFNLQGGNFLADGDYKIDAWHPRFAQTLEQTIHVKNGTAQANFQFDGAKSF